MKWLDSSMMFRCVFKRVPVVLVSLILVNPTNAQQDRTGKEAPSSETLRDYGAAFQKLIDLGLPDAKDAKYVKLSMTAERSNVDSTEDYYERQYSLGSRGNAWVLPLKKKSSNDTENKQMTQTAIHDYYYSVKVFNKAKKGTLLRLITGPDKTPAKGVKQAQWKEVDIKTDVERIFKSLDRLVKDGNAFDADRWRYDRGGLLLAAKALVIACHIYRSGHKELGNQLAGRVFAISPLPEKVIDTVVSKIAEGDYNRLFSAFLKSQDWKAYYEGLKLLIEKYPRGWSNLAGAKMLLPQVERRVNNQPARLEKINGVSLDPGAVKILDSLLERTTPIQLSPRSAWLINDGSVRDGYGSGKSEPWLDKIYGLGMKAIPALAAVCADETLIATTLVSSGYSSSTIIYSGDEYMESNSYRSMRRPCSRGEIARTILMATIPDSESELQRMAPEELQDLVVEWWKRNKNKSKGAVAKHLMEDGNERQKGIALRVLVESKNSQYTKIVEEYLLSQDSAISQITIAETYLRARKGEAGAFFEKFSAMLRDEAANDPDQSSYDLRQSGGIEKLINRLSIHVQSIKPEKIIADIKSGKTQFSDAMPMLSAAIGDQDKTKYLPQLIAVIADMSDIREKFDALQKLPGWTGHQAAYYGGDRQSNKSEEALKLQSKQLMDSLEVTKAEWRKMLTNKERLVLPEEKTESSSSDERGRPKRKKDLAYYGNPPSVAHYAAWAMDTIYFPVQSMMIYELQMLMTQSELWDFMLKRAEDVLEKGEEAYFPHPQNVNDSRRQDIRNELAKKDAPALIIYKNGLTLDEKLAWSEIIQGYEGQYPEPLRQLPYYFDKPNFARAASLGKPLQDQLTKLFSGQKFSTKIVDDVIMLLQKNADTNPNLMIVAAVGRMPGEFITLQVWDGDNSRSWKRQLLTEYIQTMSEAKANKMAGVFVYGLDGGYSKPEAAVAFDPPINPKEEDKARSVVANKVLEYMKSDSAEEDAASARKASVIFTVETQANILKSNDADQ